jgi:hypothetical protein
MVMQKLLGILFVCLRRRGGLGVKNIEVWNRAPMVKHLWSICNPSKSFFLFGKLMYVLKEEDTNIIRGIPQIYNDNRNIKQQMATG